MLSAICPSLDRRRIHPTQDVDITHTGAEDYLADLNHLQVNTYVRCIATTLLAYDTIYLMPQEAKYMYRGTWTRMRIIYFLIRITTWFYIISIKAWSTAYLPGTVRDTYEHVPLTFLLILGLYFQWCIAIRGWLDELASDVIIPSTMKVLLILRLRAVWNNNRIMTFVLFFLTTIEVLNGILVMILSGWIATTSSLSGFPFHGCIVADSSLFLRPAYITSKAMLSIVRMTSTSVETLLTIVSFIITYRRVHAIGSTVRQRILHIQSFAPLVYVFYRDGTLLFIPVWIFTMLEFLNDYKLMTWSIFQLAIDWTVWVAVVYSAIGARLVLNLREADCSIGESLVSKPMQSLQFRHTVRNNDSELGTSEIPDASDGIEEEHR
ncbi:hypothetical protein D9756_010972 [Leucocoprinus leucothites]|uniref:DUF6533 domain-containing protein n=1 Tax=Leucocoprinus leucothites TaxID=201217 RepID=A0A8H5CPD0_9AGAR|nr:hypothetical protein D9756_010972 [Leucoagaricus leucothites]